MDTNDMRYIIMSQPKAGTYLTANILHNLNIADSGIHIQSAYTTVYIVGSWRTTGKQHREYKENTLITSLKALSYVEDEEFVTGHLQCTDFLKEEFKNDKKILLLRNTEDIRQSALNYLEDQAYNVFPIVKSTLFNIKKWEKEKDVFVIYFDDLINKNIEVIDNLQKYLFDEIRFDSLDIITKSLEQDSPTKSNLRKQQFNTKK